MPKPNSLSPKKVWIILNSLKKQTATVTSCQLGKIFIRIVDSDDNDYELKYDRADIIDALKTYEIAK